MSQNRRLVIIWGLALASLIIIALPTAASLHAAEDARPLQSHDFTDVPVTNKEFMEPFIDAFYHQGVTGGCSVTPLKYCPENPVTRGEMAVFIGRALGYRQAEIEGLNTEAYFKQTSTANDYHGIVATSPNGIAVYGFSFGEGVGVFGESVDSPGVDGFSMNHYGVRGISPLGIGVYGSSLNTPGVYGTSITGSGVEGISTNGGAGVLGNSNIGYGMHASANNYTALYAQGAGNSAVDTMFDIELGGGLGEIFSNELYLVSNTSAFVDLDNDDNNLSIFGVRNGTDGIIFSVDESGQTTASGTVSGTSTTGNGIFGTTTSGYGVAGVSVSGNGVYGTSTSGYGVYAYSPNGTGVYGTSIDSYGVEGHSTNGIGSYGFSTNTYGVRGTSTNSYGVYAVSTNATGLYAEGNGNSNSDSLYDLELGGAFGELFASTMHLFSNQDVYIHLDSDNNGANNQFIIRNSTGSSVVTVDENGTTYVNGSVSAANADSDGVTGTSTNAYGVRAISTNTYALLATSSTSTALYAEGQTTTGESDTDSDYDIKLGGALGEIYSTALNFFSDGNITLDLDNDNNSASSFIVRDGGNNGLFSISEDGTITMNGNVTVNGNHSITGSKSAIVDTVHYGTRTMYSVESTESWFEDFGSAKLVNGVVVIEIDPMFAETVNLSEEYHIYLTPIGDAADLYIDAQTPTSFTVRDRDRHSEVRFHYRIVAKRLGYEDVRLEEVGD